jgi:Tol biopolymer transport system component
MRLGALCSLVSTITVASLLLSACDGDSESGGAPLAQPAGPDRIAFNRATTDFAPRMLWTVNVDGSDPAPVGDQQGWWPDWSPDRTTLVFDFTTDDDDEQVATIHPDGSGLKVLTEGSGYNEAPDYTPDGRTIIYAHSDVHDGDPGFATELWLMNPDGSDQRRLPLSDGGGDDTEPEYSPDGSRIVFLRYRHDEADRTAIHVAAADGSGVRRLTPWRHKVEHPRWSPDGTTIIYNIEDQEHADDPVNGIWTVPAAGGRPAQLLRSTSSLHGFKPDYSPDGTRIVFGCIDHAGFGTDDICIMNADGTGVERVVATDHAIENNLVWR